MCRNIHTLYNFEPPATHEEIHAAALQYVRKVSGFTKPSQANQQAFDEAVAAVSKASAELLGQLVTNAPPRTARSRLPAPASAPPSDTRRSPRRPPEAQAVSAAICWRIRARVC